MVMIMYRLQIGLQLNGFFQLVNNRDEVGNMVNCVGVLFNIGCTVSTSLIM